MVRSRALRLAALAGAALVVASCSLTRLAYNNVALAYSNGTPLLTWFVSDYVDLSGTQREFVRERLARAFVWHRADELPGYRRFLDTVLGQAAGNITAGEARADYREVRERYHRVLDRLVPDTADFLLQLDAEQATQLERKFAEDTRKAVNESTRGTPGDRFERRVRRALDHIEEFTGTLADAQRELVARYLGATVDTVEDRIAEGRYRRAEIVALARAKPPRDETIAALRRLLVEADSWRRPEYLRRIEARDEKLFEMVAALSVTLSAEQRAHFQRRVHGFMSDISGLTASN